MQLQRQTNLLFGLLFISFASSSTAIAADNSLGLQLSSEGLGLSYSKKTQWHLRAGDQIQWRLNLSGFSIDDIDEVEISDIDYEGDAENFFLQSGLDWFPFQGKIIESVFISGGLVYSDLEASGISEENQSFSVGNTQVGPGDGIRIESSIEQNGVAPYLSFGWGNRIRESGGFAFRAELGVYAPLSDADIDVKNVGQQFIPMSDLEAERREIEDDADGLYGFFNLGVFYQF